MDTQPIIVIKEENNMENAVDIEIVQSQLHKSVTIDGDGIDFVRFIQRSLDTDLLLTIMRHRNNDKYTYTARLEPIGLWFSSAANYLSPKDAEYLFDMILNSSAHSDWYVDCIGKARALIKATKYPKCTCPESLGMYCVAVHC